MRLANAPRTFGFDAAIAVLAAASVAASIVEAIFTANADFGDFLNAIRILYPASVAILFGLAALSLLWAWRIRWYIHWFAVACALVPILLLFGIQT